jgi:hypothetical protein
VRLAPLDELEVAVAIAADELLPARQVGIGVADL